MSARSGKVNRLNSYVNCATSGRQVLAPGAQEPRSAKRLPSVQEPNALLAAGVSVRDFDGHPLDAARRRAKEPTPPEDVKPVRIGDNVWIGNGALIMKGVTIGDRAVVAARSVVTRDVPTDVVVAGVPARVVKHLEATDLSSGLTRARR